MSFKRWLTSVLCSCILLSFILLLPASALDDDNYYSVPSVASSDPSLAVNWSLNSVSGEYSSILGAINQSLGGISSQISDVLQNQVSIAQILSGISGILTNNGSILGRIESSVAVLSVISDKVATESTLSTLSDKVATNSTLTSLSTLVDNIFYPLIQSASDSYTARNRYRIYSPVTNSQVYTSFGGYLNEMNRIFTARWTGLSNITMFGLLQDLRNVLANEDDQAIREQQKQNQDTVKDTFLSGSSSGSSLGKDDFSSLSSVGGTFKDISSLNGQASLDSFSSGLTDADAAGQGWFSQSTKEALDSVTDSTSSESIVSTFSDDGLYSVDVDPDPYNMADFENNYAWLWGEK